MCYFLYGMVDGEMSSDLKDVLDNSKHFNFMFGKYNDLIASIKNGDDLFRLTNNMCDCDTTLGNKKISRKDVKECSNFTRKLIEPKNIKHLYICKKWASDKLEGTTQLHIDDIDNLYVFFANIKPNMVYEIGVYKRYY